MYSRKTNRVNNRHSYNPKTYPNSFVSIKFFLLCNDNKIYSDVKFQQLNN